MPAAETFVDTNLLLYLISADTAKADAAERQLERGAHVSVQILNEFTNVARRKAGLQWAEIDEFVAALKAACTVHPIDVTTHDHARALAERYRLAFYDALVVASAIQSGCGTLLSEDLQHGQRFEGRLTVRDPFRTL